MKHAKDLLSTRSSNALEGFTDDGMEAEKERLSYYRDRGHAAKGDFQRVLQALEYANGDKLAFYKNF